MDTWPLALRTARLICFPADPAAGGLAFSWRPAVFRGAKALKEESDVG